VLSIDEPGGDRRSEKTASFKEMKKTEEIDDFEVEDFYNNSDDDSPGADSSIGGIRIE
jgi:hypothetical protein